MKSKNLFGSRFFAPIFWTQFLGAFNDNVFKNALVILMTYKTATYTEISSEILIPLSAGLFILPFFLFSALAGQLADKFEKSDMIRRIKLLEISIMLLAAIGFYIENIWFLLIILFLMGCQSSLFGPIKYSILPQHLNEKDLLKGNGYFSMGTFLAILVGTLVGGILVTLDEYGTAYISALVVFVAVSGWLSSRKIPPAHSVYQDKSYHNNSNQKISINWNIFVESWDVFKRLRQNRLLTGAILAISWFWFTGATILTILPGYTKNILYGNELVVTLLLALFSIGIGSGSVIAGKTKTLKKSIKWIFFGAVGISLFSAHIYWNSAAMDVLPDAIPLREWQSMFEDPLSLMVLLDVLLLGLSGGLYIVPLYVILQEYSEIKTRSRNIAANNILNAFLMVCSAIVSLLLLTNGVLIYTLFFLLSIANLFIITLLFFHFSSEMDKIKSNSGNEKLVK
ncbi:MAG: MFS transporter [gamma proteobacterium symbiont of Taylorina sp.]|nr:MFS transporter [gamma proteobacterium symbiont of Taylorina sp.]